MCNQFVLSILILFGVFSQGISRIILSTIIWGIKMVARKTYILKLYVAGNTPNSMRALNTLKEILETEFKGVYALKVIDVLKSPQLAEEDKILATPTLAKILPPPVRKIIGDLSDREKVLIGLDLLFDELNESELKGSKRAI
tara:strand:- start:841 stop:1266 length:426 start_codon:yes stop_codon:yes gene_type:complete